MKLSTKGQYGVRAMYDLAQLYGGAPQSVKCIAERQGIPEAYLEQLIAPLRKAGLVSPSAARRAGPSWPRSRRPSRSARSSGRWRGRSPRPNAS